MNEVYGVDLDGTLAEYTTWKGANHIGKAIPKMLDRVKGWISEGIEIIIFTARATDPDNIPAIINWLEENGIGGLEISNIKTPNISRIYDDRAIQVKRNEGDLIGYESMMIEWIQIPEINNKLTELYSSEG